MQFKKCVSQIKKKKQTRISMNSKHDLEQLNQTSANINTFKSGPH